MFHSKLKSWMWVGSGCLLLLVAQAAIAVAGLVDQWGLSEGTGSAVAPTVGTSTGTLGAGATWNAEGSPAGGKSISFDGTANDLVTMPSDGNPPSWVSSPGFSVAIWAKTSVNCADQCLMAGGTGSNWVLQFGAGNPSREKLWFGPICGSGSRNYVGWTAEQPFMTSDFSDGRWHFFVGVVDGVANTTSFYADGRLVETQTANGTGGLVNFGSGPLTLGGDLNYPSQNFVGTIGGPVQIYNNALSFADVQTLYQVPEPSACLLLASGILSLTVFAWRKR